MFPGAYHGNLAVRVGVVFGDEVKAKGGVAVEKVARLHHRHTQCTVKKRPHLGSRYRGFLGEGGWTLERKLPALNMY